MIFSLETARGQLFEDLETADIYFEIDEVEFQVFVSPAAQDEYHDWEVAVWAKYGYSGSLGELRRYDKKITWDGDDIEGCYEIARRYIREVGVK